LLAKVDLADRGGSKFKTYSLGMKQRLGIAAALLPNPELLILDEPTNGLDPSGIQEVRGIIRDLAIGGTTVFVSSHILSELEMICEYLVMLREGKVIFSGRTQELLSAQKPIIIARPEYEVDLTKLTNTLSEAGYQIVIVDGSLHIAAAKEASAEINRLAFDSGITLSSISVVLPTLEETFFEMTGDNK
jgi:ABC-2 type transport system ATP-binding protein